MDLKFCKDGSLEVDMLGYVNDVINDFPEDIGRRSYKTPVAAVICSRYERRITRSCCQTRSRQCSFTIQWHSYYF